MPSPMDLQTREATTSRSLLSRLSGRFGGQRPGQGCEWHQGGAGKKATQSFATIHGEVMAEQG